MLLLKFLTFNFHVSKQSIRLLTSSLGKWTLYHISWQIHPLFLVQARQSKLSMLHPADL